MMQKSNFHLSILAIAFIFINITINRSVIADNQKVSEASKSNNKTDIYDEDEDSASIWDSKPEEIQAVNVQILDKISGKVINKRIRVNQSIKVAGIEITLKRCFKNSPEDSKEIYAFIEIGERKSIFSKWLFASSPSINLFAHPQYDVRVEF
ncbi:MAG: DUF2155 domain-containing protein [Alphaproteobacteria bacterium]|nr:DUF2155 domain-containing protein [Alphaproteobacteria bacterium]